MSRSRFFAMEHPHILRAPGNLKPRALCSRCPKSAPFRSISVSLAGKFLGLVAAPSKENYDHA
eukprot:8450493-Pyramimonas_sp.AAC.1